MERRKAANNEIFDILLKSALITRYENEVSAAMLSADEHTYPAEFHRRLRQIKNTAGRKERISAAGRVFSRLAVTAAAAMGILFGCLLTRPEVSAAVGNVFRSIFLPMTATASRQAATLILTKISVSAMCLRDMN